MKVVFVCKTCINKELPYCWGSNFLLYFVKQDEVPTMTLIAIPSLLVLQDILSRVMLHLHTLHRPHQTLNPAIHKLSLVTHQLNLVTHQLNLVTHQHNRVTLNILNQQQLFKQLPVPENLQPTTWLGLSSTVYSAVGFLASLQLLCQCNPKINVWLVSNIYL